MDKEHVKQNHLITTVALPMAVFYHKMYQFQYLTTKTEIGT